MGMPHTQHNRTVLRAANLFVQVFLQRFPCQRQRAAVGFPVFSLPQIQQIERMRQSRQNFAICVRFRIFQSGNFIGYFYIIVILFGFPVQYIHRAAQKQGKVLVTGKG